jgi:hypothetical protein
MCKQARLTTMGKKVIKLPCWKCEKCKELKEKIKNVSLPKTNKK